MTGVMRLRSTPLKLYSGFILNFCSIHSRYKVSKPLLPIRKLRGISNFHSSHRNVDRRDEEERGNIVRDTEGMD